MPENFEEPSNLKTWIRIILALVIAGYLIIANYSGWWPFTPAVSPPATPSAEIGGDEEGVDDLANWQTYRNEEFGFEMKYPGDYVIYASLDQGTSRIIPPTENESRVSISSTPDLLFCCEPFVLSIESFTPQKNDLEQWINESYLNSDNEYRVTQKGYKSFNNIQAYRVYSSIGIDSPGNIIAFNRDDHTFLIRYDNPDDFDQILSTFKFIN